MRVLIVGAGAVGSFLAWALATSGARTMIVRRGLAEPDGRPEQITVVPPEGLPSIADVTAAPSPLALAAEPDLVVVAVKQYDLPGALASFEAWPLVPVLTVENGVGAEETAMAQRPRAAILAGSVTASLERADDGSIRWLRTGGLGLAAAQPRGDGREIVRRVATLVGAAGVPVRIIEDAAAMKWSKLVGNLVANATGALLDADPADIYADPRLFLVERDQLRETFAVMRARNLHPIDLPGAPIGMLPLATRLPPPIGRLILRRVVSSARGGKEPSLRPALRAGGRTEVGWLNGAVARAGADVGVPTPVNATLARLVDEAAANEERRAWFRHRPDRLVAELAASPGAGGST